jgi:hypothetical protein
MQINPLIHVNDPNGLFTSDELAGACGETSEKAPPAYTASSHSGIGRWRDEKTACTRLGG